MTRPVLYIGNKNYSSWSMRPWLALKWAGIEFDERVLPLGAVGYGKSKIPEILAVSPSGRVPALHLDGGVIWDSLAICEWAAEQAPSLWPADPLTRATARSAAAEMHSGFAALRGAASMNLRRRTPPRAWSEDVRADISRIEGLWDACRASFGAGGPWLFGARCIADAMFAPVCTRFRTYAIELGPVAAAYCETVFADPDFRDWDAAASAETWTIPSADSI